MVIEKITRTYSRSINLKSYGSVSESWVKAEATYVAQCESGDDPINVSKMLAEQAQKDVADQISIVIDKVRAANPKTVPADQAHLIPAAPDTASITPRSL